MASKLVVEVQDTQSLLWYNAHIIDKEETAFVVKYTDPLL